MRSEKLSFPNPQGQTLSARLDLPVDGKPRAYALFAHCFTCSMNLKAVVSITRALTGAGIAVLRFDFTGLGESEGEFADTGFASNVADLVAAAEMLQQRYQAPSILIGHSLGGTAVLHAASAIPSAVGVATIGAPFEPAHVLRLLGSGAQEIEARGEAVVNLSGRPFRIRKQFLDELQTGDARTTLRSLNKALLVLHSPVDTIVDVDNAAEIFLAAKHPKSFISLDRADHLLTRNDDSIYVGAMIAAWASKYIGMAAPPRTLQELGESQVVVRTEDAFLTEVNANGHALLADEPQAVGGTDLGPSPYDYLVTALGTCTAMTLRMYADRKQWPLQSITVRLKHRKIHAGDCADCETKAGQIDRIDRELELAGPLDAEQRQKLLEIADKCPVHRTLHGEVKVRTTIVP